MMQPRKFGPRTESAHEGNCAACRMSFIPGDYTTLVAIGPGEDSESRERCRAGRPYNAVAVEAHWACVTGEED